MSSHCSAHARARAHGAFARHKHRTARARARLGAMGTLVLLGTTSRRIADDGGALDYRMATAHATTRGQSSTRRMARALDARATAAGQRARRRAHAQDSVPPPRARPCRRSVCVCRRRRRRRRRRRQTHDVGGDQCKAPTPRTSDEQTTTHSLHARLVAVRLDRAAVRVAIREAERGRRDEHRDEQCLRARARAARTHRVRDAPLQAKPSRQPPSSWTRSTCDTCRAAARSSCAGRQTARRAGRRRRQAPRRTVSRTACSRDRPAP